MADPQIVGDVLDEYVNTDQPTAKIAKKYGISTAIICVWAKAADIPLRSRGRRRSTQPSPQQRKVVEMHVSGMPLKKIGKAMGGLSKQRVSRIIKRWKTWDEPKQPPFTPGDIIEWGPPKKEKRYVVMQAGIHMGRVLEQKSEQVIRNFVWNLDGIPAVKVGVDRRYVNGR